MLGTRRDAQLTCVAIIGICNDGLFAAVDPRLHPADQRKLASLPGGQRGNLENVEWTDSNTVRLAFAAIAVDDGCHATGHIVAVVSLRRGVVASGIRHRGRIPVED